MRWIRENWSWSSVCGGIFGGVAIVAIAMFIYCFWGPKTFWEVWGASSGWAAAIVTGAVGWTTLRPLVQQAQTPRIQAKITAIEAEIDNVKKLIDELDRILDENTRWDCAFFPIGKVKQFKDRIKHGFNSAYMLYPNNINEDVEICYRTFKNINPIVDVSGVIQNALLEIDFAVDNYRRNRSEFNSDLPSILDHYTQFKEFKLFGDGPEFWINPKFYHFFEEKPEEIGKDWAVEICNIIEIIHLFRQEVFNRRMKLWDMLPREREKLYQ